MVYLCSNLVLLLIYYLELPQIIYLTFQEHNSNITVISSLPLLNSTLQGIKSAKEAVE